MESAENESSATVTRSQHIAYILPPDRAHIAQFMAPFVARIDRDVIDPQVIVVTPDSELALAIVSASNDHANPVSVLPVAGAKRAARRLRVLPAQLVAGDARALLELVRSAALKLDAVRGIVVAWADHIIDAGDSEALDALFGELPKDVVNARAVVAERMTPEIESLIERHLRRARRVEHSHGDEGDAGPVSALVTSADGRGRALRRVLDELDPERALVVATSDESAVDARRAVDALGHSGDQSVRVVSDAGDVGAGDLVVIFGLPSTRATLVKIAAAAPSRVIALVEPRQMSSLRRIAGSVVPFVFADATRSARTKEEQLRDELRRELSGGTLSREMLALEPLLSEYDGTELAAAALRLLEKARASGGAPASDAAGRSAVGAGTPGGFTKVFITIGSRDGVTVGDLVGAISGESGISSSHLGKVDIRESFTLVEVAAGEADRVIAAMAGSTVRGRRLAARLDKGPEGGAFGGSGGSGGGGGRERSGPRSGPPRGRPRDDSRPPRDRAPRDRDERPRGGPREGAREGAREGPRGGKPPRGRDAGPPRGRDRDDSHPGGGPRRDRESLPPDREQWTSRTDAMRNAKRPPRSEGSRGPTDGGGSAE